MPVTFRIRLVVSKRFYMLPIWDNLWQILCFECPPAPHPIEREGGLHFDRLIHQWSFHPCDSFVLTIFGGILISTRFFFAFRFKGYFPSSQASLTYAVCLSLIQELNTMDIIYFPLILCMLATHMVSECLNKIICFNHIYLVCPLWQLSGKVLG